MTTTPRRPGAAQGGRIANLLSQRRDARVQKRADNYAVSRAPVSAGAGEIVEIHDDETPLTDIISRARFENRGVREVSPLHVSDLIGKCMRRFALVERYNLPVSGQQLSLMDSLTFRQGDVLAEVLRVRATKGGPQSVWGNWECKCGKSRTEVPCLAQEVDQTPCEHCGSTRSTYVEVPMYDPEIDVVGNPDIIQYLHAYDCFYVNELKSMAHARWEELVRPIPEHVIQGMFYWYLMHRQGYKMANRFSIVYVTKGWLFSGSPIKEFSIDAAAQLHRLEPHLEDARALKAARAGEGGLPLRTCASPDAPEAKKCDACTVCFKDKDEAPKTVSATEVLLRKSIARNRPVTK